MSKNSKHDCCKSSAECCAGSTNHSQDVELNLDGPYICYCDKVTKEDILRAIDDGASTIQEAIKATGAMQHCNCAVNNPKVRCCSPEFFAVFDMYSNLRK